MPFTFLGSQFQQQSKGATCLRKVQALWLLRNEILPLQVLRRNRSASMFLYFLPKTTSSYHINPYLCLQYAVLGVGAFCGFALWYSGLEREGDKGTELKRK